MATLYVTEYAASGMQRGSLSVAFGVPVVRSNNVTIGGGSAQSAAFNGNTTLIRVHTDAICSILIGASPTAAATDARMAADQTEYFAVAAGQKIAVITNT